MYILEAFLNPYTLIKIFQQMEVDYILQPKAQDQAVFGFLFLKAFAKVNRNYEGTNYGWMAESMRAFTGAPSV